MPPEKLKNCQITNPAAAALEACEDLMLCILARLPVKSICRFKSVCKPWNHLLSTREFVKMQFKLSTESKNHSFLVHNMRGNNNTSVFNIESSEKKAKILDHPFDYTGVWIGIVGCCRGLVCTRRGKGLVLWNPAMNLYKTVSPYKDYGDDFKMSLGFGYDAEGDDFKVVRIVWLKKKRRFGMCISWVEVYSANSDSWTTIDPGLFSELSISWINNRVTVNGNPCWVGRNDVIKDLLIIRFDMSKLVFNIVTLSNLDYNKAKQDIEFVDLNGSLGALVVTWKNRWENIERIEYVDNWVYDDGEQIWTKSHSVPIEVKMIRVLRCLKDGRVLGMHPKSAYNFNLPYLLKLIEPKKKDVFNSETKCVKGLFNVH
ncbi:hypothetical protein CASFOL_027817 [Castilleja foliolosa]|uniref:F-box domain-containing protein n=1 Tax=Castilleja foliolosa TaxID=1961234 RepID=A0ABD3CHH8_9LAMI